MSPEFFQGLVPAFSSARLESYRTDDASDCTVLARHLFNAALAEGLYSPLQFCEVALRNGIHSHLSEVVGTEWWFESSAFDMTPWAKAEIDSVKKKIQKAGKEITSGRVVAGLSFGFWTSLFEDHYEKKTPFLPRGIKSVFPYLPKRMHNRKDRKADLERIRQLRNRVSHHERTSHWKDLDAQHTLILDVIGWMNPSLKELAEALDRFKSIREAGLKPWMVRILDRWPSA